VSHKGSVKRNSRISLSVLRGQSRDPPDSHGTLFNRECLAVAKHLVRLLQQLNRILAVSSVAIEAVLPVTPDAPSSLVIRQGVR
jgi:hypothetical protein